MRKLLAIPILLILLTLTFFQLQTFRGSLLASLDNVPDNYSYERKIEALKEKIGELEKELEEKSEEVVVQELKESCSVNINEASQEELEELIGLGPVLAQNIIQKRPFSFLSDLLKVEGIGKVTLERIKEQGCAFVEEDLLVKEVSFEESCSVNINEASQEELKELTGVGPVLAQNIIQKRPFSSLSDLLEVIGIGPAFLKELKEQGCAFVEGEVKPVENLININKASQEQLEKLAGIGPVYAERIIEERPFNSIYELTRVVGIGEAILKGIIEQGYAFVEDDSFVFEKEEVKEEEKKECGKDSININKASQKELEELEGIGPVYAERIIQERPFNSIYELIRVTGIGEITLEKIIDQGCAFVEDDIGRSEGYPSSGGGSSSSTTYSRILISEIQLFPIKERFIELYNPSDEDIDLTNWYIQRKTDSGTSWNSLVTRNNFKNKTIQTNDYFLITREEKPNSDLVVENLTLSEDNSLVLKNPNGEIIDLLGWGDAQEFQKASFPENPRTIDLFEEYLDEQEIDHGNTERENSFTIFYQSLGRKFEKDGYSDTKNNKEDFEIQTPTPGEKNKVFEEKTLEEVWEEINDYYNTEVKVEIPSILIIQEQATFEFEVNKEGCSFKCKLNEENWQDCHSPKLYENLEDGQYTFSVKGIDLFSQTDFDEYTWNVGEKETIYFEIFPDSLSFETEYGENPKSQTLFVSNLKDGVYASDLLDGLEYNSWINVELKDNNFEVSLDVLGKEVGIHGEKIVFEYKDQTEEIIISLEIEEKEPYFEISSDYLNFQTEHGQNPENQTLFVSNLKDGVYASDLFDGIHISNVFYNLDLGDQANASILVDGIKYSIELDGKDFEISIDSSGKDLGTYMAHFQFSHEGQVEKVPVFLEIGENLLKNKFFEEWDGDDQKPEQWEGSHAFSSNWFQDNEHIFVGDYSVRARGGGERTLRQRDLEEVLNNKTYHAEVWVKGTGKIRVGIIYPSNYHSYGDEVILDNDNWTRISHTAHTTDSEKTRGGIAIQTDEDGGDTPESTIYIGAAWLGAE